MLDKFLRIFFKKQEKAEAAPLVTIKDESAEPQYSSLQRLINTMQQAPIISEKERKQKHRAFSTTAIKRMIEQDISFGEASKGHAFLNEDSTSFQNHLKAINNDLGELVKIVDHDFHRFLECGEIPAPYYPWRIAIILSKAKRKDLEYMFLHSWCMHFGQPNTIGKRYEDLIARFDKLKALHSPVTRTKADE